MEIKVGNSYKTKGGFKATIISIDENHSKPYLAWVMHKYGRVIRQYYRSLNTDNHEFEIIELWDNSELPIYYRREVCPEKIKINIDNILDVKRAVEANSKTWFQDEEGNKYQGSKTWAIIYNKLLEKKNKPHKGHNI